LINFKLNAAKFDPATFLTTSIGKPMGMDLVEVEPDAPRGVMIGDLDAGGNAKAGGKVYKGLFIVSINSIDVKYKTFDEILDIIGSVDGEVEVTAVNPNDVFKGKALLDVTTVNGDSVQIECLKGQTLRDVLLQSKVDVYAGSEKLTNCGGGASCGTCVVDVTFNDDWDERPDFEAKKLRKYASTARLSCNTAVEGDAVVVVKPQKIA
jgi:ferredoxin